MADFDSSKVNVGDKVFLISSHYGTRNTYIVEVLKITPTGLIDVKLINGKQRFRRDGTKMGRSEPGFSEWLEYFSEDREKEIKEECRKRWLRRYLSSRSWDYDLEALEQFYITVAELERK